jgi:predicted secreted protein
VSWQASVAIYLLFWVLSAFLVLPFGVRTHEEAGVDRVAGQADSAPSEFRPWRIAARTTLVATILFTLFYANYVNGWLTPQMFDFWGFSDGTAGSR